MTPDLRIRQGIVRADGRGVRVLAASDGFLAAEAERIAVLFGDRPGVVACPLAHFACPFGPSAVAVVQVADRTTPGTAQPALFFRFLVLGLDLYRFLADPFAIADRYPPPWEAGGTLPDLAWPEEVLPPRKVADVQDALKHGDCELLLGAVQALVDGSRLLVQRPGPDETLLRHLWLLLPEKTRRELWPASFAFSNELRFHIVVLPEVPAKLDFGSLTEEQARDYPAGRYELNLHIAADRGDQRELDRLFTRRTSDEMMRLGLGLIAAALVLAVLFKFVL